MTEILCRWLNEEVHVEPKLNDSTFAVQFSNGYLFGMVLHKYGLQIKIYELSPGGSIIIKTAVRTVEKDNFEQFSKGWSSESKLNNFMKLEPTFRLLDIPFNINMAHDIMTEKPGVATRLMYQLFVALNRKKQRQLTGPSLECMRPSGKAQLERIGTGMFQARLKNQTSRQVDLDFEALIQKFHKRHLQHVELVAKEEEEAEERTQQERREACLRALENSQKLKERQLQLYSKLKPLSPSKKQAGKTSPRKPTRAELQARERTWAVADETRASIDNFEASLRRSAPPIQQQQSGKQPRPFSTPDPPTNKTAPTGRNMTVAPSADYISQIRKRVQDDTIARKEREKRRRKVLVEQMNALQEQEEMKREKMLVDRLMRQCQQERRIATQLMHIRKEKDTIRNNRIQQQKQYEQQRAKEFEEALNREAELARQAELECRSQLQHHLELHRRFLAEKAEKNYQKHYHLCQEVLLQMVDFSVKLAHYRELTQGLVPAKLVRDWKTLFIAGRPLFEEEEGGEGGEGWSSQSSSSGSKGDPDKEQLLDETDVHEYRSALCEWTPPPSLENQLPRPLNPILSHVVYRLLDMVDPPQALPIPPQFPRFLMKACFVGKPFSGKSTALQRLSQYAGVTVLCIEQLLTKAVDVYTTEKQAFDKQLSTQETAPVITGDNEEPLSPSHPAPTVTVEPSSSARLVGPLAPEQTSQDGEEKGMAGEGGRASREDEKNEETKPGNTLIEDLSPLAALGMKAYTAMASGQPVDDHTMIGIITEELRSLPDGSAWVLESFPVTVEQAKLLASALTGQSKPLPQLSRNFVLLVEPENREEELHAVSGLDLVMHFSASTEVVLQRASQQDGTDQIQHRLLSFDENWPGLRRWYQQFRNLSTINANQDIESVCSAAQKNIQEVINKAKQADAMKKLGLPDNLLAGGSMLDLSSRSMTRIPPIHPIKEAPRVRKRRPSSAESPAHKLHVQTQALGKKRTRKSPARQHMKVQLEEEQLKPKESESDIFIPINPNAEPGSAEWQYCSLSLSEALAKGLAGKWSGVEETYLGTLKGVFRLLRGEREAICHYFYLRRREFGEYLRRPDHKQEFLQQWQQSYNTLPAHLRREDTMKAELHHRVDDLCDKLWDICDRRKGETEGEKKRLAEDHWLEDHLGLLSNHYISLMQVELDKFQDAVLLLKDYYNGMEGNVPAELPKIARVPLIELSPTKLQEPPTSATSSVHSIQGTEGQGAATATAANAAKATLSPSHETPKRRVPLLPRQPPSEPAEEKGAKKKGGATPFSPPPAEDLSNLELDQQLIVHAYNTAIATVFNLLSSELKVLDTAIEKASQPAAPTQQEKPPEPKEEKGGKGKDAKKDKAKSPAGKKGKASPAKGKGKGAAVPEPTPATPAPPSAPSAEEISKKQQLLHMWREHKAAIQHEELTVKLHLEVIKTKAMELVTDLKAKAKNMHVEMEEWIGQCYKKEVESVSNMAEVLRQAIESEEKLLHELQLPGPVFQIQQSMMTFVPSRPSSPPPPCEISLPDKFTVCQLLSLHQQFATVAPLGFMLSSAFVDTMLTFADKTVGDDLLPENWCGLTRDQVESICKVLYGNTTEYVDWRRFLVVVAQPWPLPTPQQLVAALQQFTAVAPVGTVSRQQYSRVQTWLVEDARPTTEGYNRAESLKDAFFDIFADPVTHQLDYKEMLLYLCVDPDLKEGLFKALSVAVGEPITSQQANNAEQAILLQDFHKVLVHGLYKSDTGASAGNQTVESAGTPVSMEHLFELFVQLSPGNPSEVAVGALLSNPTALVYLDSCNQFSLPDLTEVTKSQLEPSEAD